MDYKYWQRRTRPGQRFVVNGELYLHVPGGGWIRHLGRANSLSNAAAFDRRVRIRANMLMAQRRRDIWRYARDMYRNKSREWLRGYVQAGIDQDDDEVFSKI